MSEQDAPDNLDLTAHCWRDSGDRLAATITRISPEGDEQAVEVEYYILDGKAIIEGDISIGDAETVARQEASRRRHDFSFFVTGTGQTWPNGVVPYTSDGPTRPRADWLAAYFAAHTPIRLVPYTGQEQDYIVFQAGAGNDAWVGRKSPGPQQISLADGASQGDAIHEVCHALGLWHEHTRPDRDHFIDVFMANIVVSDQPSFNPLPASAGNYNSPYDINSIMHYPSTASAVQGKYSMLTKQGGIIGPRNGLSAGDLAGLRFRYPQLHW